MMGKLYTVAQIAKVLSLDSESKIDSRRVLRKLRFYGVPFVLEAPHCSPVVDIEDLRDWMPDLAKRLD